MNLELALTSKEILMASGLLLVLILAVIFFGRFLMTKKATENLTDKYKNASFASPLIGRSKYPDVDVFQYSSSFFLFRNIDYF